MSAPIEITSKETRLVSEKPAPLIATAFGISDTGKVRTANDDQFLIAELANAGPVAGNITAVVVRFDLPG